MAATSLNCTAMYLTRQFLREFRPLFRMLEESLQLSPAARPPTKPSSLYDKSLLQSPSSIRLTMSANLEGNHNVVEAEPPGVKTADTQAFIGAEGHSAPARGKIVSSPRRVDPPRIRVAKHSSPTKRISLVAMVNSIDSYQLTSASTLKPSVRLPRQLNSSRILLKPSDCILTVAAPQTQDARSAFHDIHPSILQALGHGLDKWGCTLLL